MYCLFSWQPPTFHKNIGLLNISFMNCIRQKKKDVIRKQKLKKMKRKSAMEEEEEEDRKEMRKVVRR